MPTRVVKVFSIWNGKGVERASASGRSASDGGARCSAREAAALLAIIACAGLHAPLRAQDAAPNGQGAEPLAEIERAFERVEARLQVATSGPKSDPDALSRAAETFRKTVREPLDRLIAEVGPKVSEDPALHLLRNRAELARVNFLYLYAAYLPEESPERRRLLEEGLEFATDFVENRPTFYVMQYSALIQKGLYLLDLGRFRQAGEELSILFDIVPPGEPPYADHEIRAFRSIRLRALYFGVRALNSAGRHLEAKESVDNAFLRVPEANPFHFSKMTDDELRNLVVLVKLEYAIALMGTGEARRGLDLIHEVIETEQAAGNEALVIDARKALGRAAAGGEAGGEVELTGRDYYEAAIGLKSEVRLEEALRLFQKALVTLSSGDVAEYAPLCLNEIGEVNDILERYAEAAVAFREICIHFPGSSVISKAAQNYLAEATRLQTRFPEDAGYAELHEEASSLYDSLGSGLGNLESEMARASQLIGEGRYAEAREIYARIPEEHKGQRVPFFLNARASACWMVYLEWESTRAPDLESRLARCVEILPEIYRRAIDQGDSQGRQGAAVASLALGQIHASRNEWRRAITALEPFLDRLAGRDIFGRCGALSYLVEAAVNLAAEEESAEETAVQAFKELYDEDCRDDPNLGYAALRLSRHFSAKSSSVAKKRAGTYMKIYAESPYFHQELQGQTHEERIETYLRIAETLIEGDLIYEAKNYINLARDIPGAGGLERQQLYLEALILERQEDYDAVIEKLGEYTDKYKADGSHFEDPYVWWKLAIAHLKKGKNVKNVLEAERYYHYAWSILYGGIRDREDAPASAVGQCWEWIHEWIELNFILGKAGSTRHLKAIVTFVDAKKDGEMGGLRDVFIKYEKAARRLLDEKSKANGKKNGGAR